MSAADDVLEAARFLDMTRSRKEFALSDIVDRAIRAGSPCSEETLRAAVFKSKDLWRIDRNWYRLSSSAKRS